MPSLPHALSPSAAAVMQTECTHDIDAQAALLRGWNQRYEQLSAGAFEGRVVAMDLGPVRVLREFTSRALHQVDALSHQDVAVGIAVAGLRHAMFCGQVCEASQALVFSGAGEFEFHTPEGMQMLDFVVDKAFLQAFLTESEQQALAEQNPLPHLRPAGAACEQQLQQLVQDATELLAHRDANAQPLLGVMATEIASQVASLLAQSLHREEGEPLPLQRRGQLVQRARGIVVDSGAEGAVTVEGLCQELAVSRRALQYSFQDVLGMSPLSYLRAVRLNGARQAMKRCGTVAEAATSWGFWHFGRFSKDYKALFGELPSATLRRCH